MSALVSISGRTYSLTFPPTYEDALFTLFKPFQIKYGNDFDASFAVELSEAEISFDGTISRGNIFFREYNPTSFSIRDSRFNLIVALDTLSAQLIINSVSNDAEAIIFSALKWFMTFVVIYEGGLPMHSSLIAINGSGILFCGPSGRGKTTIRTLLSENLRDSIRGSDELNVVFPESSLHCVFSTPFVSSGGAGDLTGKSPLKSVYFLEQSSAHHVESITARQAFKRLLSNVYHVSGNKLLTDCMLNTIEQISTACIYHILYFNNDNSIAPFLMQQTGRKHAAAA